MLFYSTFVSVAFAIVTKCVTLYLFSWRVKQGFSSHTVGVIQSNPAQSKHLATATVIFFSIFFKPEIDISWFCFTQMRIDGISLDFVNLRTEAYADNGRIPTEVSFGSPMEGKRSDTKSIYRHFSLSE